MLNRFLLLLFATTIVLTVQAGAGIAMQQIGWRDLTFSIEPGDDPYFGLTYEQRLKLETFMALQSVRKNNGRLDARQLDREKAARSGLQADGLDADALREKSVQLFLKIQAQRTGVRREWDNKTVRIPGYLVPLEFDGETITEFLLVPYAGACVHTPPPPANQIIHVTATKGFRATETKGVVATGMYGLQPMGAKGLRAMGMKGFHPMATNGGRARGLFDPVWVEGRLSVENSRQAVGLSDGNTSFDVGYAINASSVERYE
ncbi:MAG: DUF3299 domain-containing protein [Anderseniella sp.]